MAVERLCPPVACNITVSRKKTEARKIACDLNNIIHKKKITHLELMQLLLLLLLIMLLLLLLLMLFFLSMLEGTRAPAVY